MPSARWQLEHDRPVIRIQLIDSTGHEESRTVLADTGSGSSTDLFDLVLEVVDCIRFGGHPFRQVAIGGAYSGTHAVFVLEIEIPTLCFRDRITAVGVPYPRPMSTASLASAS